MAAAAIVLHAWQLHMAVMPDGHFTLTLTSAISVIGLQLGIIASLAALEASLRGVSSILFMIAATAGSLTYVYVPEVVTTNLAWKVQMHIALSMFAYGLLTAGAIVAVLALIQDMRLRAGRLSPINHLFAPLETTEKLLYGVASAGFVVLAMAVVSGVAFVEDLFAQNLAHKTVLSLLAVATFGILVIGRQVAGWRGKRAVYLYLGGFALLLLAYFGTRYILEEILNRSWG
ncbi:MAG: cytochrome c biogenesis protein CcsA [Woeseiaceae bacterium]|nr:cytochrome c biogenesis protein CcsA [Woeseiaceae bacterium]